MDQALNNYFSIAIYASPLLLFLLWYLRGHAGRVRLSAETRADSLEAGLTEPASLHPVIDPARCIGCLACADACPEMPAHTVIGIVHGKAELVSPTDCIGHGACQAACPVGAIELVFGTARRGVDIPAVQPDFETNVTGIYIAGELGGMGLIRNAVEQGRQAMDNLVKSLQGGCELDVLIVGAGPAGFAASLGALDKKLRFVTVEQDSLGGTVAHFPRGKLVMTAPAQLPIVGKMNFRETSKERLLEFWQGALQDTGLTINFEERVERIEKQARGFVVKTTRATYRPEKILLCIGRRGTPRSLDVPGEELPKVTYRLIDPEQYRGQSVLVVGGGDSALEAACTLAQDNSIQVTLAYRSEAFTRAKKKNRQAVQQALDDERLRIFLNSTVKLIEPEQVVLQTAQGEIAFANDAVIVNAGGILPTGFLQSIGITVETKHGTR